MKFQNKYLLPGVIILLFAVLYSVPVFILPAVLNSKFMQVKYEKFLSDKLGVPVKIEDFYFKTKPNLVFDIDVKSVKAPDVLNVEGLKYKSKPVSVLPSKIDGDSIYFNYFRYKNLPKPSKSSKGKFNLKHFPLTNVKQAYVQLDKDNKTYILISDMKSQKDGFFINCEFLGKLVGPYFSAPVYIGKSGKLRYFGKLYYDNLSVDFGKSRLILDGDSKKFSINGKGLPVRDLEGAFLYYYKATHPGKKNFIENFRNFQGLLDADLIYSSTGLNGICRTYNLGADFSKFNIPVLLPNVEFYFGTRSMKANATGLFGGEKVDTDVDIQGLFTKKLKTVGNVHSKLTNNFTQKYFKPVKISGSADARVKYYVHDGFVDVDYILTIPKGSDLITKFGHLSNTSEIRQISAHTFKNGDDLYLKNYDYGFIKDGLKKRYLYGEGLFQKVKGHFKPSYLTLKTEGNVPTNLIGSMINDFVYSGTFNSDIKYDFKNKISSGVLNFYDVRHEDFLYLGNVSLKMDDKNLRLNSAGTFFDSPITMEFLADNKFDNGLNVSNIDIKLDSFYVRRGGFGSHNRKKPDLVVHHKHKDIPVSVKKGRIRVAEIFNSRFYLHDVEIFGSLKDDVVDFIIPKTEYAQGLLAASGKYNLKKHNSDIYFSASDINSDEVATKMFNLPGQFEGTGYANLHLLTKDRLNDICAIASFAIEDGFLPKLGSREIILNRSKKRKGVLNLLKKPLKFTLSKITNIDFSKPNVFYSDLQGSFYLHNSDIECVKIYSQSDYLSMLIEGNYNIDTQVGDLTLWGKHNKIAEKKIRILKLPLSLLYKIFFRVERSKNQYTDKIEQIPDIKGNPEEIGIFRVQVDGNLNSNDINVTLKDIK